MKIYFKGGDSPDIKNINDLLVAGFTNCVDNSHPEFKFARTYHDSECKQEECKCARRSFPALLDICLTYFPETTQEDLAKCIYALMTTDVKIGSGFCPDISRVVFFWCNEYTKREKPYFQLWGGTNNRAKKGNDNWSFDLIMKLVEHENV